MSLRVKKSTYPCRNEYANWATGRDYVRKCDRKFIDCVSECAKNVIKGNVSLTDRQKARLRRNRNDLRAVSLKKTSLRKKRRIVQNGGFLTALMPPVLSALVGTFILSLTLVDQK